MPSLNVLAHDEASDNRRVRLVAAVELMNRREDVSDKFMAENFAEVNIDACA